jgi:alpha-N-arabinofuranosidase
MMTLANFILYASLLALGSRAAQPAASWDFTRSLDDQRPGPARLMGTIGRPEQSSRGVRFDGSRVEGLVYDLGTRSKLRLAGDCTLWVRAAFECEIDRPFANHDTLVDRWSKHGNYSFLFRSDHHSRTLCLFLSPDGKAIHRYDSGYRVDRSGQSHDLAVVVRRGDSVAFFVDGRLWCRLRHPQVPQQLHDPEGYQVPFSIGYNQDMAPAGDHESMNGTIGGVKIFRSALSEVALAGLSGITLTDAVREHCSIRIDTSRKTGRVHPYLFGQFLEHFQDVVYGGVFDPGSPHSDADGFRLDVLSALKELKPTVLRWPGGNYTSAYHWRWGAVPRKYRPRIYDEPVWHQTESHAFGTPEFIMLCSRLEAEPLICVGVGRDPRCPRPEEAAAWVRYCNSTAGPEAELRTEAGYPEPFDVTLWGLGNEVYGRWQIGHYKNPQDYAADLVAYANAMRAADPRLRFVICGDSYKTDNTSWNRAVLTPAVVELADWISFHTYTHMGAFGPRLPHELATHRLLKFESDLESLIQLNQTRRGTKPLAIAVDEWNELAWAGPRPADNKNPRDYNLAHALHTAGFLNLMLRNAAGITMANYSPAVNCRGLVQVSDRGVLKRSSYHIFAMYRPSAGGHVVNVESDLPRLDGSGAPVLDIAAIVDTAGTLRLHVVNRHPDHPQRCAISLPGFVVEDSAGQILTGTSLNAFNDFDHPGELQPESLPIDVSGSSFDFVFPPRSAVVFLLTPRQ